MVYTADTEEFVAWMNGRKGRMGRTPRTVTTVIIVAHDGLWEHIPRTILTLQSLLKDLHCLQNTLWMNTLLFYDRLGHQELENIAHDWRRVFIKFMSQDGTNGRIIPLRQL